MAPDPHRPHPSAPIPQAHAIRISPAEQRVLALILTGCSNTAIANTLMLSRRTVEGHVSMLLHKTGCHSRTQLALWALERGKVKKRLPA